MQTKYRADVDGLRACAIAGVVLFHAYPKVLSGGFYGVDVFFVISGYLISGLILAALERGTFSFADFYRRRVRRIFPSLSVVLVAVLILGYLICYSTEFTHLAMHVAAGSAFSANLMSWHEAGYFDVASELKPLLNLWSLGIEEQFYIFWPVLLVLGWRAGRKWLKALILVTTIGSLGLHVGLGLRHADAAFYSPFSRSWELMVGAWIACAPLGQIRVLSTGMRTGLAWTGAALMAFAFGFVNASDFLPGWSILPVVGTAMLLVSGPDTWLHRHVLGNRLAVGLGLISYPLYLWHWPLFSFAQLYWRERPGSLAFVVLIAMSLFLAWATYKFVEGPLRHSLNRAVPWWLGLTVALLGAGGAIIYQARGFPGRLKIAAAETPTWSHPAQDAGYESMPLAQRIYGGAFDRVRDFFAIRPGAKDAPAVAVIGDSHANRIFFSLVDRSISAGSWYNLSRGTCPPLLGVDVHLNGRSVGCQPFLNNVYREVTQDSRIASVILTAYYQFYLEGGAQLVDSENANPAAGDSGSVFRRSLERSIATLVGAGKKVVLLLDVVDFQSPVLACIEHPLWSRLERGTCSIPTEDWRRRSRPVADLAQELKRKFPQILIADPARYMCDESKCYASRGNELLYMEDGEHLSDQGANFVGQGLAPELAEFLR